MELKIRERHLGGRSLASLERRWTTCLALSGARPDLIIGIGVAATLFTVASARTRMAPRLQLEPVRQGWCEPVWSALIRPSPERSVIMRATLSTRL